MSDLNIEGMTIAPGVVETIISLAARDVEGVASIGEEAFSGCVGVQDFIVDASNRSYKAFNGFLLTQILSRKIEYLCQQKSLFGMQEGACIG